MIGIIGTDSLSLGEVGDCECFGDFVASGRDRMMKIGRRRQGPAQIDLILTVVSTRFSVIWEGQLEGPGKIKKKVFLSLEIGLLDLNGNFDF